MNGMSMVPSLPEPTAIARRPFLTSITGTDCPFSVTRVTSLVNVPTLVTWPTTPVPSITGIPARMPWVSPLSTTILRVNGLRAV